MSWNFIMKFLEIILLDITLSGDNAVVIALATRKLPEIQRKKAILIGTGGAITLRILLLMIAIQLLAIPFVKVVGSAVLFFIGFDLLRSNNQPEDNEVKSGITFFSAVRTIIVADFVMSLDNVLAVAGAADGHILWAALGVMFSIPIIVFFSQFVAALMNRFPLLVWVGALLIAYTAGKMIVEDAFVAKFANHLVPNISHTHIVSILFCLLLFVVYFISGKLKKKEKAV